MPNTNVLEIIAKETEELATRRMNAVEEFLKKLLEEINQSLWKCAGQQFIFNVYGSYEHTFIYSSRNNRSQNIKFDWLYVGTVGKGGLVNASQTDKNLSTMHGNHFKISCAQLFRLDIISGNPFKSSFDKALFYELGNPELCLHSENRRAPSWTLTDVALSVINSQTVEKNIWPQRTSDVKTLLIVGNDECKTFTKSLQDGNFSAQYDWKRKIILEAFENASELKSLVSL
jgi:hypothetical protein